MLRLLKFFSWLWLLVISFAGLAIAAIGIFLLTTPRPTDINSCLTTKMYSLRLCPGEKSYVRLQDISLVARNAFVVSEDAGFYQHHGFDFDEIRQAALKNWQERRFVRGGSTITQQLAKNVYLTKNKSLVRKIREALITIQLEDLLSKDQILEKYLNVVEFGDGLYGIGRASLYYFRKSPAQLSAAEGAYLAFLLPSPKKHSISFRKKQLTRFASHQVREIIDRLARFRKISEDEYLQAVHEMDTLFGPPKVTEPTTQPDEDEESGDLEAE